MRHLVKFLLSNIFLLSFCQKVILCYINNLLVLKLINLSACMSFEMLSSACHWRPVCDPVNFLHSSTLLSFGSLSIIFISELWYSRLVVGTSRWARDCGTAPARGRDARCTRWRRPWTWRRAGATRPGAARSTLRSCSSSAPGPSPTARKKQDCISVGCAAYRPPVDRISPCRPPIPNQTPSQARLPPKADSLPQSKGRPPPPPPRDQNDTRLWKHYLPRFATLCSQ